MKQLSSTLNIVVLIISCFAVLVQESRAEGGDKRTLCKSFPLDPRSIRTAAEGGDPYCQAVLGAMLWRGIGIKKDDKESLLWSRRSWETGEPLGLYNKGVFLGGGRGLKADPEAAKQAFRVARQGMEDTADPSDPHYEFSLGIIIERGYDGSKKDDSAACAHYLNAANSGHPNAQYKYGWCQQYGQVGTKDLQDAALWYGRASENGHSDAAWQLGELHEANDQLKEARRNYARAAEIGGPDDKLRWAGMLENGEVGKVDAAEAAALYLRAAKNGSVRASYRLAWLYFTGADNFPADRAKATRLFEEAARANDPDAINMVKALGD